MENVTNSYYNQFFTFDYVQREEEEYSDAVIFMTAMVLTNVFCVMLLWFLYHLVEFMYS